VIALKFQRDRPENRLQTVIFEHQVGHKPGKTAQNHAKLASGVAHLLCGRFELLGCQCFEPLCPRKDFSLACCWLLAA
jgi:hypothetical protein